MSRWLSVVSGGPSHSCSVSLGILLLGLRFLVGFSLGLDTCGGQRVVLCDKHGMCLGGDISAGPSAAPTAQR